MKKLTMEDLKRIVLELKQLVEQPQYFYDQLDILNDWMVNKFGEHSIKEMMPNINTFVKNRFISKVDDFIERVIKTEMDRQFSEFKVDKSLERALRAAAVTFIYIQLKDSIEFIENALDASVRLGRYDIE